MAKFSILLVFKLLLLTSASFAQDDESAPITMTPMEGVTPESMAMPSDGEFESAPAPADWDDPEDDDSSSEEY